jgi:hypothetical protein
MFVLPFVTYRIEGKTGEVYQCKVCGNPLTGRDLVIDIGGNTSHCFTNPSGLEFGFHTFALCPGATVLGDPTDAFSWFPGYRWRIAVCARCGSHVGWHYEAMNPHHQPSEFWGIIVSSIPTN